MPPRRDAGGGTARAGYTARDVARLIGIRVEQVRAFVRAGFLTPRTGRRGEHRYTLQDIVVLRTAAELGRSVPARKLKRVLLRLREQLPKGRPLSGVRIRAEGDTIVVRDGAAAWEPESGQAVFDFDASDLAQKAAPIARETAVAAAASGARLTADDWYELGVDLEAASADEARQAYERAIGLDPGHGASHVNLGRLLQEAGQPMAAEMHYRRALEADPGDPTAAFNLGVVLEELGRADRALEAYERAVAADPGYADAHYNAARLCEERGDRTSAFRHLKAYKQLTDG